MTLEPWVPPVLSDIRRRLVASDARESLRHIDRMSYAELTLLAEREATQPKAAA